MRVMTLFIFMVIPKRVMASSTDNILGLMRVTRGTRVTLLALFRHQRVANIVLISLIIEWEPIDLKWGPLRAGPMGWANAVAH